jgi:hypothetical protein
MTGDRLPVALSALPKVAATARRRLLHSLPSTTQVPRQGTQHRCTKDQELQESHLTRQQEQQRHRKIQHTTAAVRSLCISSS